MPYSHELLIRRYQGLVISFLFVTSIRTSHSIGERAGNYTIWKTAIKRKSDCINRKPQLEGDIQLNEQPHPPLSVCVCVLLGFKYGI